MPDLSLLEAFGAPFMRMTLGASVVSALLLAYLGVFVLLRRTVFVGAALPQVSAAGVALALLAAGVLVPDHAAGDGINRFAPALGAAVLSLLAIAAFTGAGSAPTGRRLPADGIIGAGYVLAAAGTVLILNFIPHDQDEITPLITGNLLTVSQADLTILLAVAAGIGLVQVLFFKEFLFTAFDPQVARTQGFGTGRWTFLWYLCLGVAISAVTKAVGIHLAFSYLVLPGLTGMLLARRLHGILLAAMGAAAVASVVGLWLSYIWSLPASPAVVASSFALLLAAAGLSRLAPSAATTKNPG